MPTTTTKVRVPKEIGDEFTVSYAGDEPVTYKVSDGQVAVKDEHVSSFLGAVQGSTTVGGPATANKE